MPVVMIAMDAPTPEQIAKYQEKVETEYFIVRFKIEKDYSDLLEQVKKAQTLEKEYAHLFTSDFYRDVYFKEIVPALGFAQAFHETIENGVSKNIPNSVNKDELRSIAQQNIAVLGFAKAQLLLIQELNKQMRKKAGL
jgi:hypothetical protein